MISLFKQLNTHFFQAWHLWKGQRIRRENEKKSKTHKVINDRKTTSGVKC